MADPKWSQIPRAQADRIGETVTSEVTFFGWTAGMLTAAIAITLLTIWMFYWIRKRSCTTLLRGAAECALALYQNSINHSVLGLIGILVICTSTVTCRLIYLHYQTKWLLEELNTHLSYFENHLADHLDKAQTFVALLKSDGTINRVNEILEQLETQEFKDEYKKTLDMVKASLTAADLGDTKALTDPLAILKKAQAVMQFASPENVKDTREAVAAVTDSWGRLSAADRTKAFAFLQSLIPAKDGTANFSDMLDRINKLKQYALWVNSQLDKAGNVKADVNQLTDDWVQFLNSA